MCLTYYSLGDVPSFTNVLDGRILITSLQKFLATLQIDIRISIIILGRFQVFHPFLQAVKIKRGPKTTVIFVAR